jgi:hypothetical protein
MKNIFVGIVIVFMLTAGCKTYTLKTVYPTLNDGKYDTEFPYKTCSKQLSEIAKTVKKLHCIAEYKTYVFTPEMIVTRGDITKEILKNDAVIKKFNSESVIGTATIIYFDQTKIALMASAHVVNYPDTVFSYYEGDEKEGLEILHSISIKSRQLNYVRDLPLKENLEILAIDEKEDIVVLGQEIDVQRSSEIHVFDYPLGDSDELEWGSFVYIMGYPSGYQMITKGIVSLPGGAYKKDFLIDGLFNKGISGGIVLAVRDGVPNFEIVGMAKSVAANYENVLVPEQESHVKKYNPGEPYTGNVFVNMQKDISYGITYSVASNIIREFLEKHRIEFAEKGYIFSEFLKKPVKLPQNPE